MGDDVKLHVWIGNSIPGHILGAHKVAFFYKKLMEETRTLDDVASPVVRKLEASEMIASIVDFACQAKRLVTISADSKGRPELRSALPPTPDILAAVTDFRL